MGGKRNISRCLVLSRSHSNGPHESNLTQLKGSVKEPNMFHNYETEKITRKASDAAENLQLYRVVQFFRPRSLCMTTHLMLFSESLPIYALSKVYGIFHSLNGCITEFIFLDVWKSGMVNCHYIALEGIELYAQRLAQLSSAVRSH